MPEAVDLPHVDPGQPRAHGGPPVPVLPAQAAWTLHGSEATRQLEAAASGAAPPHALMAAAGLALARLLQAVAGPDAGVQVLAGGGNNGGDGLVAARHLQQWGRQVQVHLIGDPLRAPEDARWALDAARQAGVPIREGGADPAAWPAGTWVVDALLGLGASQPPRGPVALAMAGLAASGHPVLSVDLPSGLCADTGRVLGERAVQARHTLSLLTLHPGLFTGAGRDHAGRIWLHRLGQSHHPETADAWLSGPAAAPARHHAGHKGRYGDAWIVGGATGMGGAALLAARAALAAGAGRVHLARLDAATADQVDALWPELMPRPAEALPWGRLNRGDVVVCGCGGGRAVAPHLVPALARAPCLVLDADALNALAADAALQAELARRAARGQATVLTPHPLEAARLLGCSTAEIQADRLRHARALAERSQAVVVLKGSGSVVAAPGQRPRLNPTGSARLATAGSGDVLAGWLGGWLAGLGFGPGQGDGADHRHGTAAAPAAAAPPAPQPDLASTVAQAVWLHGRAGEQGDPRLPLRAADLIDAMCRALPPVTDAPPASRGD